MAKKTVKKAVRRSAPRAQKQAMPDDLKDALVNSLNARANPPKHRETQDARASVLEKLAEVFLSQNDTIRSIAEASVSAPNFANNVEIG